MSEWKIAYDRERERERERERLRVFEREKDIKERERGKKIEGWERKCVSDRVSERGREGKKKKGSIKKMCVYVGWERERE